MTSLQVPKENPMTASLRMTPQKLFIIEFPNGAFAVHLEPREGATEYLRRTVSIYDSFEAPPGYDARSYAAGRTAALTECAVDLAQALKEKGS